MKTSEITLAKALELFTKLDKQTAEQRSFLSKLAGNSKYRGERISEMDLNRLLYFVGTTNAMKDSLEVICNDHGLPVEDSMELVFNEADLSDLATMTQLIVGNLEYTQLQTKRNAAMNHLQYFDEADKRRIKKDESLKLLLDLDLI